jgi:hypothetical protein
MLSAESLGPVPMSARQEFRIEIDGTARRFGNARLVRERAEADSKTGQLTQAVSLKAESFT